MHFHILTDDKRSEQELRYLFNKACKDSGLDKNDFRVDYKKVTDGYWYFEYFTKFDRINKDKYTEKNNDGKWKRVLLFRPHLGLQKFYQIGKWFNKSKAQIWKKIIADTKAAAEASENE